MSINQINQVMLVENDKLRIFRSEFAGLQKQIADDKQRIELLSNQLKIWEESTNTLGTNRKWAPNSHITADTNSECDLPPIMSNTNGMDTNNRCSLPPVMKNTNGMESGTNTINANSEKAAKILCLFYFNIDFVQKWLWNMVM